MTFEAKKDYVKDHGRRVAHNISEKKLDLIIEELVKPKTEIKLTRMIYINSKGKSIIDIPENKVEAHLKAGWKRG